MLMQKHAMKEENLLLPPNYASLLDHPTRKLIEYSRIHLTVRLLSAISSIDLFNALSDVLLLVITK